eukprot:403345206
MKNSRFKNGIENQPNRNYNEESNEHNRYDEEGYLIPETPPTPPNIPLIKTNLKLLKSKIQIKEQPSPFPDQNINEAIYDESTMNHENPGTYHNNFYRRLFVPTHLLSQDTSQWNPNDPYRQLKYGSVQQPQQIKQSQSQKGLRSERDQQENQFQFGRRLMEKLQMKKMQRNDNGQLNNNNRRAGSMEFNEGHLRKHLSTNYQDDEGDTDHLAGNNRISQARLKLKKLNRQNTNGNSLQQSQQENLRLPLINVKRNGQESSNNYSYVDDEEVRYDTKSNDKMGIQNQKTLKTRLNQKPLKEEEDYDNGDSFESYREPLPSKKKARFNLQNEEFSHQDDQDYDKLPALPKRSKILEKVSQLQQSRNTLKSQNSSQARPTQMLGGLNQKPNTTKTGTKHTATDKNVKKEGKAKSTKWRQKSEMFRQAMKAARGGGGDAGQADLAAQYDDRKQCPNCKRKFNEQAAEKHIKLCNQKYRQKGVKVY